MKAYIFRAELICHDCAADYMRHNVKPDHVDMADESTFDSDEWPKGPYANGGGEADTPQHCGHCGTFLENPLTSDGASYVRRLAEPFKYPDTSGDVATWSEIAERADADGKPHMAEWFRYYFAPGL